MAGIAYALAAGGIDTRRARIDGAAIAAAAFIPPAFLSLAFPEGGWAPFPFTAYLPIPVFSLACLLVLPRRERALRWGAALYGIGATFALIAQTPMGGNAVRLGALFGGRFCCARSGAGPGPRHAGPRSRSWWASRCSPSGSGRRRSAT